MFNLNKIYEYYGINSVMRSNSKDFISINITYFNNLSITELVKFNIQNAKMPESLFHFPLITHKTWLSSESSYKKIEALLPNEWVDLI